MGRKSTYNEKMADVICQEIAQGQSLKKICERDDRPDQKTVFNWLHKYPEFLQKYARAREAQMDAMSEEILEIADTPIEGERTEEGTNAEGGYSKTIREDMLGHRRLQVDARKWLMSKLAPKKYGDKLVTEQSGPDGGPVEMVITWKEPDAGAADQKD